MVSESGTKGGKSVTLTNVSSERSDKWGDGAIALHPVGAVDLVEVVIEVAKQDYSGAEWQCEEDAINPLVDGGYVSPSGGGGARLARRGAAYTTKIARSEIGEDNQTKRQQPSKDGGRVRTSFTLATHWGRINNATPAERLTNGERCHPTCIATWFVSQRRLASLPIEAGCLKRVPSSASKSMPAHSSDICCILHQLNVDSGLNSPMRMAKRMTRTRITNKVHRVTEPAYKTSKECHESA